jgi:hypothetical protein
VPSRKSGVIASRHKESAMEWPRFPFKLILPFVLLALLLVGRPGPEAILAGEDAAPQPMPTVAKEDLRYDGKPFSYWEFYAQTELKAERRIDAVRALGAFGAAGYAREATASIVALVKEYRDECIPCLPDGSQKPTLDERVIIEAALAVRKIGPKAAPGLLSHLHHKTVREFAEKLLRGSDIPATAIPLLIHLAQARDREIGDVAVHFLSSALEANEHFTEVLKKALPAREVKPFIHSMVWAGEHGSAQDATRVLNKMGKLAKPAVGFLVKTEILGGEAASDAAREALATLKPRPQERIPGLLECLESVWTSHQKGAADKLAEMGQAAQSARAALIKALKKPISGQEDNDDRKAKLAIVAALEKIGAEKREIVAGIIEFLDRGFSAELHQEMLRKLMKLEKDPTILVPVLKRALQKQLPDRKQKGREWSIAYGRPASADELDDPIPEIVAALGKQGAKAKTAVPLLVKAYQAFESKEKRILIVTTLGAIGPEAEAALPLLNQAFQADNADLRRAAALAIKAVFPTQKKPPKKSGKE